MQQDQQFQYDSEVTELDNKKRVMLKRIDQLKFCKWHFFMVLSLGTTWIFDGYEVSMLSLVALELKDYFNESEHNISKIASFYLAGCCMGALLFGTLAFNYGRKSLFFITISIYIVSVIGSSLMTNYYLFIVFRVLTGIAVGGEYTAIFAAVDEFIPPVNRGYTDLVIDGTWHCGSCIASLVSIAIFSFWDDNYSWRIMFLFGAIGSIPIIILRRNIPESPRWLLSKYRYQQANQVIDYIEYCCLNRKFAFIDKYNKVTEMLQKKQNQESINSDQHVDQQYQSSSSQVQLDNGRTVIKKICIILFQKYPQRTILGATLMACQAFFYQGIFYTFGMNVNEFFDVPKNEVGYYMIPLSVASFSGPLLLGRYFDTVGRKKMIFFTYLGSAVILTLLSFLFQNDFINIYEQEVLLFLLFIVASPGASSAHLVVSEIFPSEMRSQVMGIFFCLGFGAGGIIAPAFFGMLIEQHSRDYLALGYYIAALLMSIASLVGLFLGVNAEKLSLEEISAFKV